MVKVQRLFAKTNLKIQVYRTESKELEGALFPLCAEHGTNLAGASPVTGIYRQV